MFLTLTFPTFKFLEHFYMHLSIVHFMCQVCFKNSKRKHLLSPFCFSFFLFDVLKISLPSFLLFLVSLILLCIYVRFVGNDFCFPYLIISLLPFNYLKIFSLDEEFWFIIIFCQHYQYLYHCILASKAMVIKPLLLTLFYPKLFHFCYT